MHSAHTTPQDSKASPGSSENTFRRILYDARIPNTKKRENLCLLPSPLVRAFPRALHCLKRATPEAHADMKIRLPSFRNNATGCGHATGRYGNLPHIFPKRGDANEHIPRTSTVCTCFDNDLRLWKVQTSQNTASSKRLITIHIHMVILLSRPQTGKRQSRRLSTGAVLISALNESDNFFIIAKIQHFAEKSENHLQIYKKIEK